MASTAQDDGLLDDLLAQMDQNATNKPEAAKLLNSVVANQQQENRSRKKRDPRKKFDERKARKAAARAAAQPVVEGEAEAAERLAREKDEEERLIKNTCESLGLEMYEINPDGHCLFSAVADQLAQLRLINPAAANYKMTRAAAASFMLQHPDEFMPFIPSVQGEDGAGATSSGLITPAQFAQYCATVRDTGAWGGEPEIMALCRAYSIPIHVVQWGQPPIVCHSANGVQVDPTLPSVKISYHRRMYGLGEVGLTQYLSGSIIDRPLLSAL
ncbi:hypothetical protein FRB99_000965 [Tulasnella sp. 403]|nr:hypothetical protein FRB99_000965 [Tulasnella sp. 403]